MRIKVVLSVAILAVFFSVSNLLAAGHWEIIVTKGKLLFPDNTNPRDFTCLNTQDTCFTRYIWVETPVDTTTPIGTGITGIYIPGQERGYANANISMMLDKDGSLRVTVSGDKLIEVSSREELLKYLEELRASQGKQ